MLRYNLDALGWLQFEEFCQSAIKSCVGKSVVSWGGRGDHGRDAYCGLPIQLSQGISTDGPFVFQIKMVEGANAAGAIPMPLLMKAVNAELNRIAKRIEADDWEQPNYYILVTNVNLNAEMRLQVAGAISAVLGCNALAWGGKDLCDMLDATPALRLAFPQLLGLRDIEQILSEVLIRATIERSKAQLSKAVALARLFVPTQTYYKTVQILQKHHFAVLTGPPEMGKTAIGLIASLAKADEGWRFYDCVGPDDFLEARNDDLSQVFLVDDAFGDIGYRPDRAKPWGDQMDKVLRRIDSKHWLIWTSRPAPLHAALAEMDLRDEAEHFPKLAEVLVDARELSLEERAKILYRHAKAAGLSDAAKSLVKRSAFDLVTNASFTPERINRFVNKALPSLVEQQGEGALSASLLKELARKEVEEPTVRMQKSFLQLKDDEKLFLLALLDAPSGSVPRVEARASFSRHGSGLPTRGFDEISEHLSDHFIRQ